MCTSTTPTTFVLKFHFPVLPLLLLLHYILVFLLKRDLFPGADQGEIDCLPSSPSPVMKLLDISQCHEDSPDFRASLTFLEVGGNSS